MMTDITGSTFGRITVLRRIGSRRSAALWLCRCECGNLAKEITTKIRNGHTISCGCFRKTQKANYIHGYSFKSEYYAWNNAKRRCTEPKNISWKNYGGRGIRMCDEWAQNFSAFIAHIGPKPSQDLTLDRIDTNGNYEPGNVRWTTKSEQAKSRRPKPHIPKTLRQRT